MSGPLCAGLIGSLAIVAAAGSAAAAADPAPGQSTPVVEAGKVKRFRGKVVTVCGKVVTYDCDAQQGDTRLDFDKPYRNNSFRLK